MDTAATNPYQAPAAEVVESTKGGLEGIVPRFSAWGVFGLNLITLLLYGYYWLYSRTRRINEHVDNPIGQGFMVTTLALCSVGWLSNFVVRIDPEMGAMMSVAGFPGGIMALVWSFKLRNRLHQIQGLNKHDQFWAGSVLTFFFTMLYLQYKINQSIDSKRG